MKRTFEVGTAVVAVELVEVDQTYYVQSTCRVAGRELVARGRCRTRRADAVRDWRNWCDYQLGSARTRAR